VSRSEPKFQVGEVAILQPPHPSASSYWGQETTILQVVWIEGVDDAMHGIHSGWSYQTAEYDLKKKYDSGTAFDDLIAELQDSELTVQHN
jgi:hypothetical protein